MDVLTRVSGISEVGGKFCKLARFVFLPLGWALLTLPCICVRFLAGSVNAMHSVDMDDADDVLNLHLVRIGIA